MEKESLSWIKLKKNYLKIDRIEKELGMPQGTLKKFVDGNRSLAEKWHKPVIAFIKKLKK